jgi:imidazolonepropionase-like amidohydrolase
MKKILTWSGIAAVSIGALLLIAFAAVYLYSPEESESWVKRGIAQRKIPKGVDTPVVIQDVTIIPMDEERVLEGQTVVIEDHRITHIGSGGEIEAPVDAYVVDGAGKFLIPGLSEMMTHTSGSENDLLVYLANGVTTIRIMGNDPPRVLRWRDQIKAGTRAGPNMWVWWPQIQSHTFFSEWSGERETRGGKTWVHSPEDVRRLVSKMAAMGVDGIKAHVVASSEVYLAIVESAAEYGLPFDGHAPDNLVQRWLGASSVSDTMSDSWNAFRTMGVTALTHVEELVKFVDLSDDNTRQATDESINRIAQNAADDGLWVTTTVHLFRSWGKLASDQEGTLSSTPEIKYIHPGVFDAWGYGGETYVELGSRPYFSNYLAAQEKMLLALYKSGALLMSGTDAPVPMMVPGFSLHDELETMAEIGLPPYDVLKTSTCNPALYLGELDEFGTVEEGKRADLVLLDANPLEDIANTRQIAGVMVRGRWYSRADLNLMLKAVAKNYEVLKATRTVARIAFPIATVLLLAAIVWIIARTVRIRRSKPGRVSK